MAITHLKQMKGIFVVSTVARNVCRTRKILVTFYYINTQEKFTIVHSHHICHMPQHLIKLWITAKQVCPSSGTAVYPHMPILRRHTAWYSMNSASLSDKSSNAQATRAGQFVQFWTSGEQSSPKCKIPCLGRRWTTVQNSMSIAISLAEKSVTIQTNKHTKTHTN